MDMVNATHAEAVAALKSVIDMCRLVVSREVLVVMPEDLQGAEGAEGVEGAMEPPSDLPSLSPSSTSPREEKESRRRRRLKQLQSSKMKMEKALPRRLFQTFLIAQLTGKSQKV